MWTTFEQWLSNRLDDADEFVIKWFVRILGFAVGYFMLLYAVNVGLNRPAANSIFLILISLLGVFAYGIPRIFFTAIGVGIIAAIFEGNWQRSLRVGAEKGVVWLYELILNIVFYLNLVAWMATLVPFRGNWEAPFVILAFGLATQVVILKAKWKGNVLPYIMVPIGVAVILVYLWGSFFPEESEAEEVLLAPTTVTVVAPAPAPESLYQVVEVGLGDVVVGRYSEEFLLVPIAEEDEEIGYDYQFCVSNGTTKRRAPDLGGWLISPTRPNQEIRIRGVPDREDCDPTPVR